MSADKYILPMPTSGFGQPNSHTCWYACYAMMYAWKKKSVAELDQNLTKAGYQLFEIKKRGLKDDEYQKMAAALGLSGVRLVDVLNWSLEDVLDRLQRWGPIFLSTMKFGGHAMVLYGVDLKMQLLIIADPYSTDGDMSSAHNEYLSLSKFRATIQPVSFAVQVF